MILTSIQKACINLILLFLLGVMFASCTVMEVGIERTATPNLQLTSISGTLAAGNADLATRIAAPISDFSNSSQPSLSPSSLTPSPTSPPPSFSSVRFAPQPDDSLTRKFYVAGTPRIFALWDYSGMREGMVVKRVWRLNEQVWIEREEVWPFTRYGEAGTVRDIYIFDDEIGIEAGKYSLALYIDGIPQDLETRDGIQREAVFYVIESEVSVPVTSPDKSHTVFVEFGGKLMMEEPDGRVWEMAEVQEISSIAWFPDNHYLLYTERDRTRQTQLDDDKDIIYRMFLIDIETGEQTILGTRGENFHHPLISPGGEYIAVLSGNTERENCSGSPTLAFIELDAELRRQEIHTLASFSDLEFPANNHASIIPNLMNRDLSWESDQKFMVDLEWVCKPSGRNPDGTYILDLSKMTAQPTDQP
jgi:hypothetical protein